MSKSRKVNISFEKAPGLRTVNVSGAWGGLSPEGDSIIMHCYTDYSSVPNYVEYELDKDGRLKLDTEERIRKSDIVREIQVTLAMSPQKAKIIGQWMIDNADKALGQTK